MSPARIMILLRGEKLSPRSTQKLLLVRWYDFGVAGSNWRAGRLHGRHISLLASIMLVQLLSWPVHDDSRGRAEAVIAAEADLMMR